jgi:hypothetical protein
LDRTTFIDNKILVQLGGRRPGRLRPEQLDRPEEVHQGLLIFVAVNMENWRPSFDLAKKVQIYTKIEGFYTQDPNLGQNWRF